MGLGLLTRLPIREIHAESLGRLPREKVQRTLIVSTLETEGRAIYVLAYTARTESRFVSSVSTGQRDRRAS